MPIGALLRRNIVKILVFVAVVLKLSSRDY